jgi:hypothetical protein
MYGKRVKEKMALNKEAAEAIDLFCQVSICIYVSVMLTVCQEPFFSGAASFDICGAAPHLPPHEHQAESILYP